MINRERDKSNDGDDSKEAKMLNTQYRMPMLWCVLTLIVALPGCGDNTLPPPSDAVALSRHYVEVTFAGPAGTAAEDPGNYIITAPDGTELAILQARLSADGMIVILMTDAQDLVEYLISRSSDTGADGGVRVPFGGSNEPEPGLLSAISLDNTSILLTFSDRMDDETAENIAFYRIADPDGDADVDIVITGAALSADETTVVLTTTPQANIEYTLQITNVKSKAGGKLIDPTRSAATFFGIPPIDINPPQVIGAVSTSDTTLLISFSEPLDNESADPLNFTIRPDLPVIGAVQTLFDTQILLTTLPQSEDVVYMVTVTGVRDKSMNAIDPAANFALVAFPGAAETAGAGTLPRVVSALSTGNTTVVVVFNKSMGDSAEDAGNYAIVQSNVIPEAGALGIVDAQFAGPDRTAVLLTTLAQSTVEYTLIAINVKDMSGNHLAPPEPSVDPSTAIFWGSGIACSGLSVCTNGSGGNDGAGHCEVDADCTAASQCASEDSCDGACEPEPCDLPDADGDGLTDNEEQLGWVVAVVLKNGDITLRDVTSDPFVADTDGDGLNDAEEKRRTSDPRDTDTDDDLLPDIVEARRYFSSLVNQDTDGDGIDDFAEVELYKTSPILFDTDGDGLTDAQELLELNRDPRIADMPFPGIEIGDISLRLDTRFSFTDTQGVSRSSEESVSTSLQQSEERSFSFSDSTTTQHTVEGKVGLETSAMPPKKTAELGYSFVREHQTTVTKASARASQQSYQDSLTTVEEIDETQSVTREVVGASVQVTLTIANLGDIPFTMTNLEVTALQQDPVDRERFLPIATLIPASQLDTGVIPAFTSGPFIPERGPFIFESRDVFPSLVEDLLKNPRGLLFNVANFDVEDEFGRNFAFTSQEINDRTVGITIDFGNSRVERFRLATYNTFDENGAFDEDGKPRGILMSDALQDLLGLAKNAPEDAVTVGPNGCGESWASGDDLQVEVPICHQLLRGDGVIITTGPNLRIDSLPLGDDVFAIVGECTDDPDRACSTDSDCSPGTCINISREVILDGGDGCAQTSPRRDDAPARIGTEPNVQVQQIGCALGGPDGEIILAGPNGIIDTTIHPNDRLAAISGYGTTILGTCDGSSPEALRGEACDSDAKCAGGVCRQVEFVTRIKGVENQSADRCDGDSPPLKIGRLCDADSECGTNGHCVEVLDRFWVVLSSDDVPPDTDFDDLVLHAGQRVSLAYVQDRDGDGLIAREEFLYGSSDQPPRGVNSDGCPFGQGSDLCAGLSFDSLGDFDEVKRGWEVELVGPPSYFAFSDPVFPDLDLDGLKDDQEQLQATDPGKRDTDDDGVSDFDEVFGYKLVDRDGDPIGQIPAYEGEVILDGGNGIAETTADGDDDQDVPVGGFVDGRCVGGDDNEIAEPSAAGNGRVDTRVLQGSDDIQDIAFGEPAAPGEVIILPGPNGIIDSTPGDGDGDGLFDGGDDEYGASVLCSAHADCTSMECQPLPGGVVVSQGSDGTLDTFIVGGDDFIAQFHEREFATDPLNRDTDGDTLSDGVEAKFGFLGANANDPTDAADFRDDDRDGLVNRQETDGWVPVFWAGDGLGTPTCLDGLGDPVDVPLPPNFCEEDGTTPCTQQSDCSVACVTRADVRMAHPECIVRSDSFEPDSDFDGLPDLLERIMGTNPKSTDTDGDGLLDFDEFDPESPFSIAITVFRDFEDDCFEADRCVLDISNSQLFGTSLIRQDTDFDGRHDFEEVFIGWVVNIVGEEPYEVFSSPTTADEDLDGMHDEMELAQGTDPGLSDTDGDGVTDSVEDSLGTNPLRPDQKIRVTYSGITVIGDCDPGTDGGEFYGQLKVQASGGNAITLAFLEQEIGCTAEGGCQNAACSCTEEGDTTILNASAEFVIQEGDTISAFSNAIYEDDGNGSANEQLGTFNRIFNYPIGGALELIEMSKDGGNDCKLLIVLDVAWVNE